jgi:hypothetical protein
VRTVSDEQGDEEGDEHLELCHLLEDIVIIFFEGTEETVQLDVHHSDEYPTHYLG